MRQRRHPLRPVEIGQHREGRQDVGHVGGGVELGFGEGRTLAGVGRGDVAEAGVAQRAAADRGAVDAVGAAIGERGIGGGEFAGECGPDLGAGGLARGVHRVDVDDRHLVGEKRLARQRQRLGGKGRVARRVGERLPGSGDEVGVERPRCGAAAPRLDLVEEGADRHLLARLPARERLGVVHRQKLQPVERHAL